MYTTIEPFGKFYTMNESLTKEEVDKLSFFVNELVAIDNDSSFTKEEKKTQMMELKTKFETIFGKYGCSTFENEFIPELNDSDGSEYLYKPFTYLRCVYSIMDSYICRSDMIDVCVEEYVNYLDSNITYVLT